MAIYIGVLCPKLMQQSTDWSYLARIPFMHRIHVIGFTRETAKYENFHDEGAWENGSLKLLEIHFLNFRDLMSYEHEVLSLDNIIH